MKVVYLVSHGEYSDYSVDYVCPDKDLADALCAKLNIGTNEYTRWQVEERPLIESPDQVMRTIWSYVEIDIDGTERRRYEGMEDHLAGNPPVTETATIWANGKVVHATSILGSEEALRRARDLAAARRRLDAPDA